MLSSLLYIALSSLPPTAHTAAIERVALVKVGKETPKLRLDALGRSIHITGAHLKGDGSGSEICPTVETSPKGITLICTTRLLWAALSADKRGLYIDLREIRGIPLEADALPLRAWPLASIGIPDRCPGELPAARGECHIAQREFALAEKAFREALQSPDASFANLRLGDIAVQNKDVEAAIRHYSRVFGTSPVARIAQVRMCELNGECLSPEFSLELRDASALPEPLASEYILHFIRRELATGRTQSALNALRQHIELNPSLCEGAIALCQQVVRAGLELEDETARIDALSLYVRDEMQRWPYNNELAMVAADAAEAVGAPSFGANVLAAMTPKIDRLRLSDHLHRVAELYLQAGDAIRASYIVEYAETRLNAMELKHASWKDMKKQTAVAPATASLRPRLPLAVSADANLNALAADTNLTTELAKATAIRSRARATSPNTTSQ